MRKHTYLLEPRTGQCSLCTRFFKSHKLPKKQFDVCFDCSKPKRSTTCRKCFKDFVPGVQGRIYCLQHTRNPKSHYRDEPASLSPFEIKRRVEAGLMSNWCETVIE